MLAEVEVEEILLEALDAIQQLLLDQAPMAIHQPQPHLLRLRLRLALLLVVFRLALLFLAGAF